MNYDERSGELMVWMTYGSGPKQTTLRKTITSLKALTIAVAGHRYEAYLQNRLAYTLAQAAVTHLGADPARLEAAVRALSDPTSIVPLGSLLHGSSPDRAGPPATDG
ncbi:hypothetical protein GTY75_12410 [Streptomyces sp. SID8381]|uniref:hypothetical protein n=1 Tax=unclassified Streptomyces TaxID=2593676 RepID=UPI00036C692F|nr:MULTISPECIES: hypothetical protein [unclassified Streptomyces]MYX27444.1 hypothetical protein [Streptomyces sp. SID8381]